MTTGFSEPQSLVPTPLTRRFIADVQVPADDSTLAHEPVLLRGWVHRLRVLAQSAFILLRDCSGEVQCVAESNAIKHLHLKLEDSIEVTGRLVRDSRAKSGVEVQAVEVRVLAAAAHNLPFHSAAKLQGIGQDALLDYRPLALRNQRLGDVFRLQNHLLDELRGALKRRRFTEIITSKLVASGTEGGTQLFKVAYFEQQAYLAQSPQFYKEHGVAAFERVFEFGHVYRAEPHASSRHLTEYYSLDLELAFVERAEDVIELERVLLSELFDRLQSTCGDILNMRRSQPMPEITKAPVWEFTDCLELLRRKYGRSDLRDDLDPLAERQLCALARQDAGVAAVFVVGFPLKARPFYTAPRGESGAAESFDLLFEGLEITTGGRRLHQRAALEQAMQDRFLNPQDFAAHLRMFELGMPPHGGLAIGLERLTAQLLELKNVREAVMYPRDRYRLSP